MKSVNTLTEIAILLESFGRVSELVSSSKSKLSMDDIYYIEYCKVKAEGFIVEIDMRKSIVSELALYRDNLAIVIEQIGLIEKLYEGRGLDSDNKVDNKMTDYANSVRKAGNHIYYSPFITSKRDMTAIYDIPGYLLFMSSIGLGIYYSHWNSTINVAETFGIIGCVYASIMGVTGIALNKYYGKFKLKKSYASKKVFVSNILTKIIMETNKHEYMYLLHDINTGNWECDSVFQICYAFAKIESLGEYINEHSGDKLSDFKHSKYIETQLRALHNLASKEGMAWTKLANTM